MSERGKFDNNCLYISLWKTMMNEIELRSAFDQVDQDGNKVLDPEEFLELLKIIKHPDGIDQNRAQALFSKIDVNGISFFPSDRI